MERNMRKKMPRMRKKSHRGTMLLLPVALLKMMKKAARQ